MAPDSNVDGTADEFVDAGAAAGFASGADGYLARVFAELHSRDALCVLARGLGARALPTLRATLGDAHPSVAGAVALEARC